MLTTPFKWVYLGVVGYNEVWIGMELAELKPLADFATVLGVAPKTVRRWATTGDHGIILTSWIVGSNRRTTASAVEAFIQERTEKSNGHKQVAKERNGDVLKRLKAKHGIDIG